MINRKLSLSKLGLFPSSFCFIYLLYCLLIYPNILYEQLYNIILYSKTYSHFSKNILFNINEGVLSQSCFGNVIIFNNAIIFSYCVRGLFHNRPLTLFTFQAGKIHSKPPTNENFFIVKCIYYTLTKTCLFTFTFYGQKHALWWIIKSLIFEKTFIRNEINFNTSKPHVIVHDECAAWILFSGYKNVFVFSIGNLLLANFLWYFRFKFDLIDSRKTSIQLDWIVSAREM